MKDQPGMNPRSREETLFEAAQKLTDPAARAAFLDAACANDPALRGRLDELFAAHTEAERFFKKDKTEVDAWQKLPAIPISGERIGDQIGRYKLLELLGEGGFGAVYVGEQTEPVRRRVALKVIKLGMDTKAVIARFEAERQALAMMDHPNIARALDAGTTGQGRPFFVMELVRGIKITEYCDKQKVGTRERLELFIKVCQAIQHAHQKGIIHRDVKPSNILVTLHDGVPVPKVIDFGIAKATEGRLTDATVYTQLHQFIGTPAYMSPEQAEMSGLDIDTRSDIYSLGVLLYELLTGKTPFDATELMSLGIEAIRKTIREKEPLRPSTKLATLKGEELTTTASQRSVETSKLLHQVKGDLDWIVMKCLEKDRTRRYETPNGLAMDIERHLTNEPVVARPPSVAYKFQKAWQRNKLVYTTGMAVVLALVGGMGISLWQAGVARQALGRESEAHRRESEARQRESKTNDQLREQVEATKAAAAAETQQRVRAEGLLETMRLQRAEELLDRQRTLTGAGYLVQLLRSNPSNAIAAARLASVMMQPIGQPASDPLRNDGGARSAEFSPDGVRVVTAGGETARVWDARTAQPVTEPLRHDGQVSSAQFSPDSLWLVTTSLDRTARVWDARTGRPVTAPLRHDGYVSSAQFSPDGLRVVTASSDNTARVWDVRTGQPVTAPLRHEGGVSSVQFSPDGLRVVTVSWDTARVWDAHAGEPVTEPLRHESLINSARFSPDSLWLVTASDDKTARVWDARTGQPVRAPLRHDDRVSSVQFSPDGLRFVTASSDMTARVWDARTGQPLTSPLRHNDRVSSAQFSPDGLRVVTVSWDTARVWDARTGQPVTDLLHGANVWSAHFSPDGLRVVTATLGAAWVWDAHTGQPVTERLTHDSVVFSAQFSPDGLGVATASLDQTTRLWDVRTGQPVTAPLRHDDRVSSVQFSPDGLRAVTASRDKTARVWDARTGQPLTAPLRHGAEVSSAQFSPDGLRVVTASWDKTARVWDARTGQSVIEPLRHDDRVSSAQFSPDGLRVVTASYDLTARVWNARTGQPVSEPLQHESVVNSARFSPDGLRVVTASSDNTARVWDAHTGQPVTEPLRHDGQVSSAQFSPDGLRAITASMDKTARVWDARTGQPVTDPLRHNGQVRSAQFSPDGLRVTTASWDNTARVWDARTGQPITEPLRHDGQVVFAQFSPEGLRAVTASLDETARVWEIPPSVVPVPSWFLDWTETRLGRRFSSGTAAAAVEQSERLRLEQAVAARTDTNYYTRLAQWVQAAPATRTISPLGILTVPGYIQRRIAENSLDSLYEALRLNPTNSLAWARLSRLQFNQDTNQHPEHLVQAQFSARQALRLDSLNGEAWCALGAAQLQSGQLPEAAQSGERALKLSPGRWEVWELRGDVLARQERPAEALQAYRLGAANVVGTDLAAFQARVQLLEKSLRVSTAVTLTPAEDSSRRKVLQQQAEDLLDLGRMSPGLNPGVALGIWRRLVEASWEANDTVGGQALLTGYIEGLERMVAANPGDTDTGKRLAMVQLWMGQTNEYMTECRKLLDSAVNSKEPTTLDRAAKACLVQPQLDAEILRQAVAAGHQALKLAAKDDGNLGWFRITAALASLRDGKPDEAEASLNEVLERPDKDQARRGLALACRALVRAHLGRRSDAQADLEAVEQSLPRFPSRPTPSPVLFEPDLMSAELLYEEAKGRLAAPSSSSKP